MHSLFLVKRGVYYFSALEERGVKNFDLNFEKSSINNRLLIILINTLSLCSVMTIVSSDVVQRPVTGRIGPLTFAKLSPTRNHLVLKYATGNPKYSYVSIQIIYKSCARQKSFDFCL